MAEHHFDLESFKRKMADKSVPALNYTQDDRSGTVYYSNGADSLGFEWEFGGRNAVAIILIPEEQYWEAQTNTPLHMRHEILVALGRRIAADKVKNGTFSIDANSISIRV